MIELVRGGDEARDVSTRRLDLRGLPPPEPLTMALAAAENLAPGEAIRIVTERRPVHLLPILTERGFRIDGWPLPDGGHETVVRRPR